MLFHAAANATSKGGMSARQIDGVKKHLELGTAGYRDDWNVATAEGGMKRITLHILHHGGESKGHDFEDVANVVKGIIASSHTLRLRRQSIACSFE